MSGKEKNPYSFVRRAFTLAMVGCLAAPVATVMPAQDARAADFKHAKKIIVPPTRIPRRYDYDAMGGRIAKPSSTYYQSQPDSSSDSSSYEIDPASGNTSSSSKRSGKLELVPPPPPVAPSLLPTSMASEVPPPPPSAVPASSSSLNSRRFSPHSQRFPAPAKNSVSGHVVSRAEALAAQGHLKDAQELLIKNAGTHRKDAAFTRAVEKVSNDRAKYYLRKDNYGEAARQARTALSYAPSSPESKSLLNQALRHQGVDPLNSNSRLTEARKLFTQGRYDQARVEYTQAGLLKPSAEAEIGLGNIAFREGKFKTAKSKYQKALDLSPQSSVAMRQLGITRYKLTDVVGANADLTRALVQDPTDKLARDNLVDLWQRQVAMRPNDANSHLGLARAYQLAGELSEAQAEYRTVVKIDPNHPNLPAARQSFKLALARQEAQRAYDAGKNLESHGAFREAFDKASQAVRLSPGDIRFQLFQAQMLEKLGDLSGARSAYLHILSLDPKNVIAAGRVKALNMISPPNSGGAPESTALKATALPLGVPQYRGEGPALPYLPGPYKNGAYPAASKVPTADPVQNMTGFLGSLRNLMLAQKKVLKADEDQVLDRLGVTSSASSSATSIPNLPDIDSSVPSIDTSKLIKSDDVKALLAKTSGNSGTSSISASSTNGSGSSLADSTAGSLTSGSTGDAQSWQAMAINAGQSLMSDPRVKNLAPAITPENISGALRGISTNAASLSAATTTTSASSLSTAPSVVRNSESLPPLAPPIQKSTANSQPAHQSQNQKLNDLEIKNRQLQSQLSQAKQELQELKSGNTGETASPTSEEANEEITETVEAELENPQGQQSVHNPLVSAIDHSAPLRGAIPSGAPNMGNANGRERVHLELLGVKAARKDIKLKVRLRNEQSTDLMIPSSKKAVIRIAGNEDQLVPIKFPKKKLAAHSVMEGYIKVPGTRLSPAADVFIPELSGKAGTTGAAGSAGNVHLTVPISSLNKPTSH